MLWAVFGENRVNSDWYRMYCRQIALPEIDTSGQQQLQSAKALIIGLGGLGSTAALLLAGLGVGTLELMDGDTVELSNLHRQIGHTQAFLGEPKVASIAASLKERFKDGIDLVCHENPFPVATSICSQVLSLVEGVDVVLDCTDQFETRHAINRACWLTGTPLVSAAAIRWEGQLTSFMPKTEVSPCYACLYPELVSGEEGATCLDQGVIGPLPSIMSSLQALEASRLLLGLEPTLVGRLLLFDGKTMHFKELKLPKDPQCTVCGNK